MSEALEHLKACRRGHRGIVTKYIQEAKSLVETEDLDKKRWLRMGTLSELLKDKSAVLKALNKELLEICPTNEIEQEIKEADNINSKIKEMHAEIDGSNQRENKKKITAVRH